MKFGLENHHWKIIESILIAPLKDRGCKIWIFGSRARGDQKEFSDLDVLISQDCDKPLTSAELFIFKEALVDSNLPIKVDVVLGNEVASSYLEQIQKDKVLVE